MELEKTYEGKDFILMKQNGRSSTINISLSSFTLVLGYLVWRLISLCADRQCRRKISFKIIISQR